MRLIHSKLSELLRYTKPMPFLGIHGVRNAFLEIGRRPRKLWHTDASLQWLGGIIKEKILVAHSHDWYMETRLKLNMPGIA
jgi:hypothetical protein